MNSVQILEARYKALGYRIIDGDIFKIQIGVANFTNNPVHDLSGEILVYNKDRTIEFTMELDAYLLGRLSVQAPPFKIYMYCLLVQHENRPDHWELVYGERADDDQIEEFDNYKD